MVNHGYPFLTWMTIIQQVVFVEIIQIIEKGGGVNELFLKLKQFSIFKPLLLLKNL